MKIAITGATGMVGRFLLADAAAAGDAVTALSRRCPADLPFADIGWQHYDLAAPAPVIPAGTEALIHCAFRHVPGRYRGGEGDDPAGFLAANRDGSLRLFAAARARGVRRVLFLSSRAVYGDHPPGTVLTEALAPRPDTLYGEMKRAVEDELAAMAAPDFVTASLRATGVYGTAWPGAAHKWATLFADFEAGRPVAARCGTEVHGADLAAAARRVLTAPPEAVSGRAFNVSDILLDRRDLLMEWAGLRGLDRPLPDPAPAPPPNAMDCAALAALGWRPGGTARLTAFLRAAAG